MGLFDRSDVAGPGGPKSYLFRWDNAK